MLFKRKEVEEYQRPFILEDPKSVVSEQFRRVRTNIEFLSVKEDFKTLVITSTTPGVGKSTVASNLAATFASQGKKVLLVDADMRTPSLHKMFRLHNYTGLSTLFVDEDLKLNDVIHSTTLMDNLFIMTSGAIPPNPAEMLSSPWMEQLTKELRQTFDLIIFDMPPITAVADAQIMAGKVDGTIFVLCKGVDDKEHIRKSKELAKSANAKVLGAIFNREMDKENHYYYYYGKSKQYHA